MSAVSAIATTADFGLSIHHKAGMRPSAASPLLVVGMGTPRFRYPFGMKRGLFLGMGRAL
jgi:hypothetical protein